MQRLRICMMIVFVGIGLAGCQHWVGISSNELVKRMGQPVNIVPSGDMSVYTYFDGLGGAPMKFFVDKGGIVRKWDASPVSTEFGTPDDTVTLPGTLP